MNRTCPVAEARTRLLRQKGRFPRIAELSGLSTSWISKFANAKRGKRPEYSTITKLTGALAALEAEASATRAPLRNPQKQQTRRAK
ncbi:MAG TPA: hypothetical protein VFG73_02435 [Rhodanobacteraceae bacterium]|nr:hypothetical protein [Rhodanobacteraceae bacterium]